MESKKNTALIDISTGIVSAVLAFILLNELHMNIAFIAIAVLQFVAGFIRGKNPGENIYLKIFIMNLLFYFLFFAILNGVFHLGFILFIAITGTALGIYIRRNISTSIFKTAGLFVVFSASVLSLGFYAFPSYFDTVMWEEKYSSAPSFTLLTPDKDTIKSSEYANKLIVMDYWASWCGPCKKQFPDIEKMYLKYQHDNRVVFLVINSNLGGDTFEKAMKYIGKSPYKLPFFIDINSETSKKFEVEVLPTTILIDKKGKIRYIHTGYEESANFNTRFSNAIESLIAQQ